MTIGESLLPEFEIEMTGTRAALDRIPDDKLDWQAHPKSRTIGWVANHLAEIPGWVDGTLTQDAWDINPENGEPYRSPELTSIAQILGLFDAGVAAARKRLGATPDEEFDKSWSLLSAGETIMTLPKHLVIRRSVMNHSIHHRGILCVYLRLNGIPVPALYGSSGDEQA